MKKVYNEIYLYVDNDNGDWFKICPGHRTDWGPEWVEYFLDNKSMVIVIIEDVIFEKNDTIYNTNGLMLYKQNGGCMLAIVGFYVADKSSDKSAFEDMLNKDNIFDKIIECYTKKLAAAELLKEYRILSWACRTI